MKELIKLRNEFILLRDEANKLSKTKFGKNGSDKSTPLIYTGEFVAYHDAVNKINKLII